LFNNVINLVKGPQVIPFKPMGCSQHFVIGELGVQLSKNTLKMPREEAESKFTFKCDTANILPIVSE